MLKVSFYLNDVHLSTDIIAATDVVPRQEDGGPQLHHQLRQQTRLAVLEKPHLQHTRRSVRLKGFARISTYGTLDSVAKWTRSARSVLIRAARNPSASLSSSTLQHRS